MPAPSPRPRAVPWIAAVATATTLGCFSDVGPGADASDSATSSTASTASTSSTGATESGGATTGTLAGCGNGIIEIGEGCDDGNKADDDACLSNCAPASCGDGVVWTGIEECDDGVDNHPTDPDACRPDCKAPACGDGGFYLGPLALTATIVGTPGEIYAGDDGPRSLGAAADGTFVVGWTETVGDDRALTQRLDAGGAPIGEPLVLATETNAALDDLVVAVAPGGAYVAAWEHVDAVGEIEVRGVAGGTLGVRKEINPGVGILQASPSVGLADSGALVVAFLQPSPDDDVRVRTFADYLDPKDATEVVLSDHDAGTPTPPTVAMFTSGSYAVAWGDPSGELKIRREGGPVVKTGLRVGSGASDPALPWSGLTVRASDQSLIAAGIDDQGRLRLRRVDGDQPTQDTAIVAEGALHTPHVDLASDADGNLAVVWAECAPAEATVNCSGVPEHLWVRWFFADLTPAGPATSVYEGAGPLHPPSVAVAPTGTTVVTHATAEAILIYTAPLQCP